MTDFPPLAISVFGETAGRVIECVRELEEAGYPRVWVGENRFDAYALAAAAAVATKRVIVGTSVAVWSRSPVQASLACATIDHLSGGRFVHGVGSGPADRNENWHNIAYRRFGARLREYLTCLRLSWTASRTNPAFFEGEFYRIGGYVRSNRPIRDPLPTYVGVARPMATTIAGELADGILLDTNLSPRYIGEVMIPALAKGAKKAGRPLSDYLVTLGMLVAIDSDHAQAIEWARHRIVSHVVHEYYRQLYEFGGFGSEAARALEALERGDLRGALDAISEEMVLAHACAGTVDEVHRQIGKWAPFVNDMRLSVPFGSLSEDEIEANWRQVIATFPPGWKPAA